MPVAAVVGPHRPDVGAAVVTGLKLVRHARLEPGDRVLALITGADPVPHVPLVSAGVVRTGDDLRASQRRSSGHHHTGYASCATELGVDALGRCCHARRHVGAPHPRRCIAVAFTCPVAAPAVEPHAVGTIGQAAHVVRAVLPGLRVAHPVPAPAVVAVDADADLRQDLESCTVVPAHGAANVRGISQVEVDVAERATRRCAHAGRALVGLRILIPLFQVQPIVGPRVDEEFVPGTQAFDLVVAALDGLDLPVVEVLPPALIVARDRHGHPGTHDRGGAIGFVHVALDGSRQAELRVDTGLCHVVPADRDGVAHRQQRCIVPELARVRLCVVAEANPVLTGAEPVDVVLAAAIGDSLLPLE